MIVLDCIQGSPEWHLARLGVLTASRASHLLNGGGKPKMPTYYRRYGPACEGPTHRAKRQRAIWEWLGSGPQPIEASSARAEMLRKGMIEECPPPTDAEPIVPPITISEQRGALMDRLLAEWATGASVEEFYGSHWTERGHEYEGEALAAFSMLTDLDARAVGFVYRDEDRAVGCSPDWFGDGFGCEVKCPAPWTHIGYLRAGNVPPSYVPQVQFSLWVTGFPVWWFLSYHPSLPPLLVNVQPEPCWQRALDEHVPAFLAELEEAKAFLRAEGVRAALDVPRGTTESEPAEPA